MRTPTATLTIAILLTVSSCAPPPSSYPPTTSSLVDFAFAPARDLDITTPRGRKIPIKAVLSLQGTLLSGTADSIVISAATARVSNGRVNQLPAGQTFRFARSDVAMRVVIRDTRPGMAGFGILTGSFLVMLMTLALGCCDMT